MKKHYLLSFGLVLFAMTVFASCTSNGGGKAAQEPVADSVPEVVEIDPYVRPVADPVLNSTARILAGLPLEEGDTLYALTQTNEWKQHAQTMDKMWAKCQVTLDKVGAIRDNDLTAIVDRASNVFYSFSGPDFNFMTAFFPMAETYYMLALEPTGKVIAPEGVNGKVYKQMQKTLQVLLGSSFFITKDMAVDMHTNEIDGTIPVFMALMARMGYEIISIDYQDLTNDGAWVDVKENSPFIKIRFFRNGEKPMEQTLYYLSSNIATTKFDPRVQAMIDKIDPETTASFVKSCSYCLHEEKYSQMRQDILDHSFALIQDDTGITYNTLLENGWKVTIYGKYTDPLAVFGRSVYQKSLDEVCKKGEGIRPLGFRFGYNAAGSVMMVAEKQ